MKAWGPTRFRRLRPASAFRRLPLLLCLGLLAAAARADDDVAVPGGPASVRRLLGLDPERPDAAFVLDLHEFLLFGVPEEATWSKIEARRRIVFFAEDLAEWRRLFGNPASFSPAPAADWKRCERALEWLGFEVRGNGPSFEADRRADEKSKRRQSFLDALGTPTASFLGTLHAGSTATIACGDGTAPLPFGLAAWRETLSEPDLTTANAFLSFVRNVRASRMLVALQALDPQTREAIRALQSAKGDRRSGWRMLSEEGLDAFASHPEALLIREGRIVLPGGPQADPIWTDVFGVAPSDRGAFLEAFYRKDGGKAAYVVDVLGHLPEETARKVLFGSAGVEAVGRFRRLYASIDSGAAGFEAARRDPYDFAHLAPWLGLAERPSLSSLLARPAEGAFPRNEAELAAALARERRNSIPGEDSIPFPFPPPSSRRRFLFLSALLADRPVLTDPGVVLLLERGFDRFSSSLAVLEDLPLSRPELARRYLFTLDRLERRRPSRDAEVSAGLFEGDVELLTEMARAGSLSAAQAETLLEALLDVPLFAREDVSPAQGESALFEWLSSRLLQAIARRPGEEGLESDDRLDRALVGPPAEAKFQWRGATYRFDAAEDEISRRRAFREKQSLTRVSELEELHRIREAAAAAAARGDLAGARSAATELAESLGLAGETTASRTDSVDERIEKEEARARRALADVAALGGGAWAAAFSAKLEAADAVLAGRHLEAVLAHVYAASARDPDDLYFQDPFFVRRHSFRTVEKGGSPARTAFTETALIEEDRGGGSRIAGSLFGLSRVLATLHADQLSRGAAAGAPNEAILAGLITPIWQMRVSRLDDDSLELVAAACRATEELAQALAALPAARRFPAWDGLARDLVSRSRLARLSALEGPPTAQAVSQHLSASDLYRIGRRLLRARVPGLPPPPAAAEASEAMARLVRTRGAEGLRQALAEFGPSAENYAGRFGLADMDMPAYERLSAYRRPEMLGDRLYDLKIAAACRVAQARLPAAILPIVLPAALDAMLGRLRMTYAYDWRATTRAASDFSASDLEAIMDDAVRAGRIVRDDEPVQKEAAS
ncbi:MAG: hypothetical protein ACM3SU_05865 [Acidobacteriota bacterium]